MILTCCLPHKLSVRTSSLLSRTVPPHSKLLRFRRGHQQNPALALRCPWKGCQTSTPIIPNTRYTGSVSLSPPVVARHYMFAPLIYWSIHPAPVKPIFSWRSWIRTSLNFSSGGLFLGQTEECPMEVGVQSFRINEVSRICTRLFKWTLT